MIFLIKNTPKNKLKNQTRYNFKDNSIGIPSLSTLSLVSLYICPEGQEEPTKGKGQTEEEKEEERQK